MRATFVLVQVGREAESFPADRASERLLAGVRPFVTNEVDAVGEPSGTETTLESLSGQLAWPQLV